ncbi:MAG: metallophosphoesterase [Deltaproteobacteria bacterium]|nr:metallophosphoesterase [Deltaproteobacteria bacterium]
MFTAQREKELDRLLQWVIKTAPSKNISYSILVSHEPPWPWKYREQECGNGAISRFLASGLFDAAIVGHCHEGAVGYWISEACAEPGEEG